MGGGPHMEHIVITLPFEEPKEIVEQLRRKYEGLKVTYFRLTPSVDRAQAQREVPVDLWRDATIIVTLSALPPTPQDAPHLDLIQLFSAGSNQIATHPLYRETSIPIATVSGVHGPQIAEWVVMTYLVHSHSYRELYELQKQRKWGKSSYDSRYHRTRDAVGLRLGVLGYGSIGRQVARVAKAMGMDIIAYTASPKPTPASRKDSGYIVPHTGDPDGSLPTAWYSGLDKPSLHAFLAQDLDILLVSVPLTDATRHMLSAPEFAVLKGSREQAPFVANIARGAIVDQPALITALKAGVLGGAALDVTDPEPLPKDSELWGMENVIVTPHVSGVGQAYTERAFEIIDEQVRRKRKGEGLLNVVRRERGY